MGQCYVSYPIFSVALDIVAGVSVWRTVHFNVNLGVSINASVGYGTPIVLRELTYVPRTNLNRRTL